MTAKALTLALAATTAAATFADVYEVKFTVKTRVGEKVANKVISGIYDDDQDKHVFWTVQKLPNEKGKLVNTNVPYTGTYFGPSNGTEAGKYYGTNAELIWGDNNENVLVAGAWGKTSKLSGQAAGMLDNVPATGTWSAKVNTKMSYDQLLAKYGVAQTGNKSTSVIDDWENKVAAGDKALADAEAQAEADKAQAAKEAADELAAAKQKAADDLIAAQEKAAKEIEAAQAEGEEAVAAAKAKAAEDLADAEAKAAADLADAEEAYNKKLAAAEAKAADDLAAAEEAYNKELKAKDEELTAKAEALKNAEAQIETIEQALNDINSSDLSLMVSDYLVKVEATANKTITDAMARIDPIEQAYTAYTKALDLTAASNKVLDAQAAYDTTNALFLAADARVTALTYTNKMVKIALENNPESLAQWYAREDSAIAGEISRVEGEIEAAKAGFTAYKAYLRQLIAATQEKIDNETTGYIKLNNDAEEAYITASNELATAQKAVADFPTTLDAFKDVYIAKNELMTYDQFIAYQSNEGTTYDSADTATQAYNLYCQNAMTTKKQSLESDRNSKISDEYNKKLAWNGGSVDAEGKAAGGTLQTLQVAQKLVADTTAKLNTITDFDETWADSATGITWSKNNLETLNNELTALNTQKTNLETEYNFWKGDSWSRLSMQDLADELVAATADRDSLATENGKAETTLTKAKQAYNTQVNTTEKKKRQALAKLICNGSKTGLDKISKEAAQAAEPGKEAEAKALAIRAKVDEFLNTPLGLEPDPTAEKPEVGSLNWMVESANRQLNAVARIRAALKLN